MNYNDILNKLFELKDQKYADFSKSLTPNAKTILGVSVPKLRKLSKTVSYDDLLDFIDNFTEEYQECLLLKGMCICRLKGDINTVLNVFNSFIPKICDWSVCDITCCGLKIFKKHQSEVFEWLEKLSESPEEFTQRIVAVCLLAHFLNDEYIEKSLNLLKNLNCGKYYADMAVGWCVATAFVKNKEITLKFIDTCNINIEAHNFAVRKIMESHRVSTQDKEFFKNKIRI